MKAQRGQKRSAVRNRKLLDQRLDGWQPDFVGTLVFLVMDNRVLLIHKKRGHGAGLINGPGGKVEAGETPVACAVRETREETGITVAAPVLCGTFKFVDLQAPQWLGYVYLARRFTGLPCETEEATPEWFALNALPLDRMWEDDRYWLPRVLAGELLEGEFLFDDGRLLTHRLRQVGEG